MPRVTRSPDDVFRELRGRRVGVIGVGVSNVPLIEFLVGLGVDQITACDQKTPEELGRAYARLRDLDVRFRLGKDYADGLDEFEVVFVTPSLIPRFLRELGRGGGGRVRLSSEIELLLDVCPGRVVGVTGSAGKTTTTSLTGEILAASGREVFVGGNIGTPLINRVGEMGPDSVVVLELSSFQLQIIRQSPEVAAVLNVSPNHLDVHASMEEYVEAKRNIYRFQDARDTAVFNFDDPVTREMSREAQGRVLFFSRACPLEEGVFLCDRSVVLSRDGRKEVVCDVGDIRLLGAHNIENVLAAVAASAAIGAGRPAMKRAIASFRGVEHRLEMVGEGGGVRYCNDSIATTPERTMAALAAVEGPIILIAGGYDKGLPFEALARAIVDRRVKSVLLIGKTAARIAECLAKEMDRRGERVEMEMCASLEDAVFRAAEGARPGDTVLLSPACASFDMFRNFEERGTEFKRVVRAVTAPRKPCA